MTPPFFLVFIGMGFEDEMVNVVRLSQEPFLILPIMFIRDFGIQPPKRREKRVLRVIAIDVDGRFRNDRNHITEGDGSGSTVIERNCVRKVRCGEAAGGRIVGNGNVHDSAHQEHV